MVSLRNVTISTSAELSEPDKITFSTTKFWAKVIHRRDTKNNLKLTLLKICEC